MSAINLGYSRLTASPANRLMVIPSLYLIIIVILTIFSIKTGYEKINQQRSTIASLEKTVNTLKEKDAVLESVPREIGPYMSGSAYALPAKDPSLLTLTQVKGLASTYLLPLEELKISGGEEADLGKSVKLSFKISGDITQLMAFIKAFGQISPTTSVDRVEFVNGDGVFSAEIRTRSYWKEYPTVLSKVTDPINKLSDKELNALRMMSQLTPPTFTDILPSGPYERSTPFN